MSPNRLFAAMLAVVVLIGTQGLPTPERTDDAGLVVFAGTGTKGPSGDGGPASAALLNNPTGVAVASDGTVYISDGGNHTVRAVTPDGIISTVAGTGRADTADAPVPAGSRGTDVDLLLPQSLAVGADNTLYIADPGRRQVLALSPDGLLSAVAGSGRRGADGEGGPATEADIGQPGGLAVGPDGTIYIGEVQHFRVRAVAPNGVISTVAGNGGERFTAAGGAATQIPVGYPSSIAIDGKGTAWIASGLLLLRLRDGKLATVTGPDSIAGGKWGISEAATWPPPAPPLNNIATVAAGNEGIYVLNQMERVLLRLNEGDILETVTTLPQARVPGALIGPIALALSGEVYLVANQDHRVYTFRPAAPPVVEGVEDGTWSRWWLLALAGVVVVVIGSWLIVRRRRSH